MTLRGIKKAIAKSTGKSFKEVNEVLEAAVEVIMESLIDSDVVHLDPIGTLELQSYSILKTEDKEEPMGRLIFIPRQETLDFLIRKNLKMIQLEEEE